MQLLLIHIMILNQPRINCIGRVLEKPKTDRMHDRRFTDVQKKFRHSVCHFQSQEYIWRRIWMILFSTIKLKIEESNRLQGKEQKKSCEKAGQRLVDDFYIMKNLVERSRKRKRDKLSPTDLFRICSSSMTCARAAPCRTQDIPIPAKIKFCI